MYPNNSNEELLIRAQVDEIYQIEEKINLLNDIMRFSYLNWLYLYKNQI